ncbi:MAG TPA: hypothetical protein PK867_06855, partial [Pirellulales bacterium]|nr:hypothetical protein [Pirellulales bacterium]
MAAAIVDRLRSDQERLHSSWTAASPFAHLAMDGLFAADVACALHARLPGLEKLVARSSLRQRKRVGVDLERYDPAVAELLFAFQRPEVVDLVGQITGIKELSPDPSLYASGLS